MLLLKHDVHALRETLAYKLLRGIAKRYMRENIEKYKEENYEGKIRKALGMFVDSVQSATLPDEDWIEFMVVIIQKGGGERFGVAQLRTLLLETLNLDLFGTERFDGLSDEDTLFLTHCLIADIALDFCKN